MTAGERHFVQVALIYAFDSLDRAGRGNALKILRRLKRARKRTSKD